MSKAIALFASSRRHGNTGYLMDRIASELGVEIIDLNEKNIAAYDYGHKNRSDDFEPLMEYVLTFDKIIFASPVYWYAVSSTMKIFLDRITDYLDLAELLEKGRLFRGKTAYVVCTSISKEIDSTYLNAYEKTFGYLGMAFGGYVHANCEGGYQAQEYENDVQAFIRRLNV